MSAVWTLLWAWTLLDSGHCSASLPDISDGAFMKECVQAHNGARSSVSPPASNMLYMTWDEALAVTARAWARHCVFQHNTHLTDVGSVHPSFSSVGENLWAGYPPSSFNASRAIEAWVKEKQDYDYDNNVCSDVCGHYTQVVWASSYKVGCAAQLCPGQAIFVCNYGPAGNRNRRVPYQPGPGCSGCDGRCEEKLCRSQERDSQKSYNWSPDWDPVLEPRFSYLPILVSRPVALILTFIAAYAVRYFYPDVFCYE
ncbi:glioma pathogenesis-related protein 1 isoform X1 [Clinocottus analis]|uniref:glioma pathogenesis-related protein 1 isoform X1 n=1 Tax=Clinocottus analis TaxID=304258 RepID=UPI0035BF4623